MTQVITYRFATVNSREVFYREAGDRSQPTIVLLYGFPSSSSMIRNLISLLDDSFHIIAPDYIGFGQSDAPSAKAFSCNFDNITAHVAGLIDRLDLKSYILYMRDYGRPVGFRIFMQRPDAVKGFVIQNANAYMEGVDELPKQVFLPLWKKPDAISEAAARGFLQAETTQSQYTVGAKDPDVISPDNWKLDQALLDRPGTDAYQLDLLEDYKNNVAASPARQTWLRAHKPPMLVLRGQWEPSFALGGAAAYQRDVPQAEVHILDAGHFALDEKVDEVAAQMRTYLAEQEGAAP